MRKQEKRQKKDDPLGDPVETLTIYNTAQLVWFFVVSVFWVCEMLISSLGRGGHFGLRAIGFLLNGAASGVAYVIAWVVVGFFSLIGTTVRLVAHGVWHSTKFVVYTIPAAIIIYSYRVCRWCLRFAGSRLDALREYGACLPERAYDTLTEKRLAFAPPQYWGRKLVIFAVILVMFALPFPAIRSYYFLTEVRADTESTAVQALSLLRDAKQALEEGDHVSAREIFMAAEQEFIRAHSTVEQIPITVRSAAKLIPFQGQKISDGERLIAVGIAGSRLGIAASDMLELFAEPAALQEHFFDTLRSLLDTVEHTHPLIDQMTQNIAEIDPQSIPDAYRTEFESLRAQVDMLATLSGTLDTLRPLLLTALGDEEKRRYLLLFQNNTELRPTGGFIGSYALIDVYQGKLVNVEIPGGGSYDLQGQLTEYVRAPQPLHLINPRWEFQDANWFPDFPSSAQKILWFYEKAGGPTVDGVLAMNASFFERLLSIIGSITMEGYDKELTAENFIIETQKAVELEYDRKENKPKQFIVDLFPKALEKIGASSDASTELIGLLINALSAREIQIYMRNSAEQAQLAPFGISGSVRQAPIDYQMIVSSTVGGGKSDAAISDEVTRETRMNEDGTIDARLILTRKHQGRGDNPFTGTRNTSYLRFYFPRGSTLISANGFRPPSVARFEKPNRELRDDSFLRMIEGVPSLDPRTGMVVTSEFEKTVFAHWLELNPGEEATIELVVRLPFTMRDLDHGAYSLLIQRQSGSRIGRMKVVTPAQLQTIEPFESDFILAETLR